MSKFDFLFRVEGDYALFTDPTFKAERVSYPVITPSAAVGVIEQIYWKPQMYYVIDRIWVERDIRFINMTVNETAKPSTVNGLDISDSSNRIQRSQKILKDVSYVVRARVELQPGEPYDRYIKHHTIVTRRLAQGKSFGNPYLGMREYIAKVTPVASEADIRPIATTMNLGTMFRDRTWAYEEGTHIGAKVQSHHFFDARLDNGELKIKDFA